jgi:hypothetical protein
MTTAKRLVLAVLVIAVAMAAAGCAGNKQPAAGSRATTKKTQSSRAPAASSRLNSNTDPCAMRLHDLCAPLLLFYARYQQLPTRIDELAQVPGVSVPELVCPASNEKYVYNPNGPSGRDAGTRIILYDASPAHAGHRLGVEVRDPAPGQALVAKVVVMP